METIETRLHQFPCNFNMEADHMNTKKLKSLDEKIDEDMLDYCIPVEEKIQMLNFQTWIKYKLDPTTGFSIAFSINEKVLSSAFSQYNICTLANKAYLLFYSGDEKSALSIVMDMENLKYKQFFPNLEKQALANQAFAYRRLGGPHNLSMSQKLYERAICMEASNSAVYLYKYQLGVVYRRICTNGIKRHLSKKKSDLDDYKLKSRDLLMDVAENSKERLLQGRSYAELLFRKDLFSEAEVEDITKKALTLAGQTNDVFMLINLGRALPWYHEEKVRLFEKSLSIRKTSTASHQLGKICAKEARKINPNSMHLSKDHPMVNKALFYLNQAVALSKGLNVPALFDYGLLLKDCCDFAEALRQFNLIVNSFETSQFDDFRSKAYQQASECLLVLYNKEKKEEDLVEAKRNIMCAIL